MLDLLAGEQAARDRHQRLLRDAAEWREAASVAQPTARESVGAALIALATWLAPTLQVTVRRPSSALAGPSR